MTAPIRDMAELVQALREAQDARDISHETVDSLSGLPSGYWSKLAAPTAMKSIGRVSLGPVLGALGKALVLVDDPEQIARVRGRWVKRGPSGPRRRSSLASVAGIAEIDPKIELSNRMRALRAKVKPENLSNSGKRRMKLMKKRARQRHQSHAARMRWSKKLG